VRVLGVVERLWRYPIKSTGGERPDRIAVDRRGLAGDRLWAVRDANGKFGSGKNTRRFRRMPGLLQLSARYQHGHDRPQLLDPAGQPVPDPDVFLRSYLDRDDVTLAREGDISHFDQLPVSVVTTATLDWVRQAVLACRSTSAGSGRTSWCGPRPAQLRSSRTTGLARPRGSVRRR